SAGLRMFMQEGVYNTIFKQFMEQALVIKVGDPFKPSTFQGLQVSKTQLKVHVSTFSHSNPTTVPIQCIMGYIAWGQGTGCDILQPMILTEYQPNMKIMHEEIFRPVACVVRFSTEEEVIEQANDMSYGPVASL
ncbi:ALDH-like protein, partial [Leucogyrophana mollusca]